MASLLASVLITRPRWRLPLWRDTPCSWRKASGGSPHTSGEPRSTSERGERLCRCPEVSCLSSRSLLPIHLLSFLEPAWTPGRLFYTWDFRLMDPSAPCGSGCTAVAAGGPTIWAPESLWCAPTAVKLIDHFLPFRHHQRLRADRMDSLPRARCSGLFKFLSLESGIRDQALSSVFYLPVCHCFYDGGSNNQGYTRINVYPCM